MNILFFLCPKMDVAYVYEDMSLRQALEKMEYHGYTAIPVIDRKGHYVGTLTEGDLLRYCKKYMNLNLLEAEDVPLSVVERKRDNQPVRTDARMEDLIGAAVNQNFVPVVDDSDIFIGIIRRRDIIRVCYDKIKENMQ